MQKSFASNTQNASPVIPKKTYERGILFAIVINLPPNLRLVVQCWVAAGNFFDLWTQGAIRAQNTYGLDV